MFFLDTNICIYVFKGRYPTVRDELEKHYATEIKIPSIVKAELLFGAHKSDYPERNLQTIDAFMSKFEIVPFDDDGSEAYGILRSDLEKQGTLIGDNDMIIAATVISKNGILITNNEREFTRVKRLRIENWTS